VRRSSVDRFRSDLHQEVILLASCPARKGLALPPSVFWKRFRRKGRPDMAQQNPQDEIAGLNESGKASLEKGDPASAVEHFSRALELLAEKRDPGREAGLLNNLGHARVKLGRLDDALATFEKAAEVFLEIGDKVGMGWQLGNAGSVCRDKEAHDLALTYYGRALAAFEETNHRNGIADQYSNIGYIHAMKSEPVEALEGLAKARDLYLELGEEKKAFLTGKNIDVLQSAVKGRHPDTES